MKHFRYPIKGVCATLIEFNLDNNKIYQLKFVNGCAGNLSAIAKLVEGQDKDYIAGILLNNRCGPREKSCAGVLAELLLKSSED